jgi:sugar-specific transcriptional regulator TrmB
MQKDLQTIGLGKNEAQVYEALVKFGPCRAGLLINKLDIHRNLVYQSLEALIEKGFVVKVIKKKVWHFQITDPKSLLTALKSKETIAHEVIKLIQTFHHQARAQIVVYEGIDSYRNYWMNSLQKLPQGATIHCFGTINNEEFFELLGPLAKKYEKLKTEKEIVWKTIHFKITPSEIAMLQKYPSLTKYRLWPRDIRCVGNFNVTDDTIIVQSFVEPLRIIEIKDSIMVQVFQNYFDMMWEKSTPLTPENIGKFKEDKQMIDSL